MKYDPIISEQMKHLPKGCLTALTEDILRQPPLPPPQLQLPAPTPTHVRAYWLLWDMVAESVQDSAQRGMNSK